MRVVLQRAPLGDGANVQLEITAVPIENLILFRGERKFRSFHSSPIGAPTSFLEFIVFLRHWEKMIGKGGYTRHGTTVLKNNKSGLHSTKQQRLAIDGRS